MGENMQRAISSGVILQTQSGHRCQVCDRVVTEVESHLRGRDHSNNLAWEVLRNPAQHPSLLNDIPRVVLEAKQRNELELIDRTVFSYRCLVCPRRPLSNGIIPLETHLRGREHRNASSRPSAVTQLQPLTTSQPSNIQNTQPRVVSRNPEHEQYQSPPRQQHLPSPAIYYQTDGLQPRYPSADLQSPPSMHQYNPTPQVQYPPPKNQYPSSHQPPASGGLAGATGLDPELQRALDEGIMERRDEQAFRCIVCDIKSTGVTPCLDHLRSSKHKKKVQAWTQQSLNNRQLLNSPPQQQYQPAAVSLNSSPSQSGGLGGSPGHDPDVQRALDKGVVEMVGTQAFRCRVCCNDLTGVAPCLEHLRSNRHIGRAQTLTRQPLPDIGRLNIRADQMAGSFDSLPVGAGRDLVNGSWQFPWKVMTGTEYFLPSDLVYRNISMPRGLVLIFNYCFPGHGEHERHGAKRDSFNLETLFKHMGYRVYKHENMSKSQTERALTNTQNDPFLRNYDCLIVFILSHGKDDQVFCTASRREEDCMKLDDVRYRFTDTECPTLKGKPKLFFVNFCRTSQIAYDGMSPQHTEPRDMMTLYACINNFRAPRDPEHGTFFVQAWCSVLAAHAHNEELTDLHRRVSQFMQDKEASVPELQSYGFKKFYFNPVIL